MANRIRNERLEIKLTEEEIQKLMEEEEKERARKDRLHQNYLKRKANGKQKEYEERYKARREEKKQEKLKVLKRTGIPVSEYKNMETKLTRQILNFDLLLNKDSVLV